ncbi:MAG: hypothetical protein JSS30_08055 [Verrucomicrobia bacterium]|nr:hypothetical protein [Verrucomicrobiota bacterium]
MKIAFKIFLFIALFIATERFCHKRTHGFRLHKIYSTLPYDPAMEVECELDPTVLAQPYHFLDSGGECYAFLSEDGQYVLKFFKHHHMRLKSPLDPLLPKWELDRRKMRYNRFFNSCKLAYDRFRKETGLVYIHLTKSKNLQTSLTITDPNHIAHKVDLDQLEFTVQKKVLMAKPLLVVLAEGEELEQAKTRLDTLLTLIVQRCKAGIADHDAQLRNFGFIGDEAIEVDLGSFSEDETLKTLPGIKRTLLHETTKMRKWIKTTYPELEEHLDEKIKEFLQVNSEIL